MKIRIASIMAAAFLAACGGATTSTTNSEQKAQAKAIPVSIKQGVSSYNDAVQALYIAYFGRPADPNGLTNFSAALQAAGAPTEVANLAVAYSSNPAVKSLVDAFGTSAESQALYGSGTTQQFVQAIFNNVLSRQPAQSGLDFWTSAIDSGRLSKGDAALAIMAGARTNTSQQGLSDALLVQNRLTLSTYFTGYLVSQNAISAYEGSVAAQAGRGLLGEVDGATIISTFETEAIDPTIAALETIVAYQGVYAGTTSTGQFVNGIALDGGDLWILYGRLSNGALLVDGMTVGKSTFSNGGFTASLAAFNAPGNAPLQETANGTYVTQQSLTGTLSAGGLSETFSLVPYSTANYDYSIPATLDEVSGTWSGSLLDGETATVAISDSGTVSGTSSTGCRFSGNAVPRPSGRNVFNVVLTFGASPCLLPGQTVSGIGLVQQTTQGPELLVGLINSSKTLAATFFGFH
jgi:hypothetical protein